MASASVLEIVPETSAGTDIATIVAQTPVVVLLDERKRADLYAHIRSEVEAFVPDLTTDKGRKAIAALAFKVTKTKTMIDAAGKLLNEEARTKINVVDEARRDARNTLDMLAEQARKPLTDWEEAEDLRVKSCEAIIASLTTAAVILHDETVDEIRERGSHVYQTVIDPEVFRDLAPRAEDAKAQAVESLKHGLARLIKEEADRAELDRLREEAAAAQFERERAEAERVAEGIRQAAEIAEANRIKAAEEAAAEQARREAGERHAAEMAAERARADEAERIAQAERDRIERERLAAAAEAQRIADEQAAREANQTHRTAVKTAAKEAIIALGCPEEVAVKIVLSIIAGEVPAVSMRF